MLPLAPSIASAFHSVTFATTTASLVSSSLPMSSHHNNNMPSSTNDWEPRGRSVIWMAVAMALHFGGYEFARSSSLALFTSPITGFDKTFAFPLAMAIVSPFSFMLLDAYARELDDHGPKIALRHTTIWSIVALGISAVALQILQVFPVQILGSISLSRVLVGLMFVFTNSYAHLLYNQHWSFLGSVTSVDGTRWFSSIAGLSSLSSAAAAALVSVLASKIGLYALLGCTAVILIGSLLSAERAYRLAELYGFDPALEIKEKQAKKSMQKKQHNANLVSKASELFQRTPSLKALFCEVISFQCMSTILNVSFITKLKSQVVNDVARAAWTGRFYATINGLSAAIQFIVLPLFMNRIETRTIWRLMPIIPVVSCVFTAFQSNPSLLLLALAFFSAKCCDYSVKGVVTEMVYVPLDFEGRFVGKELNGVFGNRLGKSGMSVLLSVATMFAGDSFFGMHILTKASAAASLSWASCAWWLSSIIPSTKDAKLAVEQRQQQQQKDKKKRDKKQE